MFQIILKFKIKADFGDDLANPLYNADRKVSETQPEKIHLLRIFRPRKT